MNNHLLCNLLVDLHDSVDQNEEPILNDDQKDTVRNAALTIGGAGFWEHCSKSRVYDLILKNREMECELTDLLHFSYAEHIEEEKVVNSAMSPSDGDEEEL
jgi:hypothetical protein